MSELPLEGFNTDLSPELLERGLEAVLFVADGPIEPVAVAATLGFNTETVEAALESIGRRLSATGSGLELRRVAGGFRLYTHPELAAFVEQFVRDGQVARLTQAALETLAVVAYKQPVSRARISAIRGVNVDSVMKTLETRGLVEVASTESDTGAFLYRTTSLFLEKLGIDSIDALPPIEQYLPDIATEFDPSELL